MWERSYNRSPGFEPLRAFDLVSIIPDNRTFCKGEGIAKPVPERTVSQQDTRLPTAKARGFHGARLESSMIDVSHFQGEIDWHKVFAAGHHGAIAKASEGETGVDARCLENMVGMKHAGMIRGLYHYFHVDADPVRQALHFWNTAISAGYDKTHDIPLALDLEDRPGMQSRGEDVMRAHVLTFVQEVEKRLGRKMVVYGDRDYLNRLQGGFSGHPLWIADISGNATPHLPVGWSEWKIWQWNWKGTVDGVPSPGALDMDRFSGNEADLRQWIASGK